MCYKPKLIDVGLLTGKPFSQYKFAPCGCCIECRNMRREEYTQRLKHEIMMNDYVASFVSLTYRDDELPLLYPLGSAVVGKYFGSIPPAYGSTLSRSDLKQFCDKLAKRFHRKYGKLPFKYIGVGEYGDDGHRPHYHLIIVGLPAGDRKMVYEAWNKGRIDIEPVGNGAIRYCLEYIDKQVFGANMLYEEYGDFQPPFALFSKGIGEKWIQKNLNKFNDYGELIYGSGKKYSLNPYYRRKYQFKTKEYITPYSQSVINYAAENKIDLKTAFEKRQKEFETRLIHKQIHNREPIFRVTRSLIQKEIQNITDKNNIDKRTKWYRDITKAFLQCDSNYLDSGIKTVKGNISQNVVKRITDEQNSLNYSTLPMCKRIELLEEYNTTHIKQRAISYLESVKKHNI